VITRIALHVTLTVASFGLASSAFAQASPPAATGPATKPAEPLKLTIDGSITPDLAPVVGRMAEVFYETYPKLLARFETAAHPAARHIKLVFVPTMDHPAHAAGGTITVSADWLRKHPDDVGLFTHELMHIVQGYPPSKHGDFGWFTEGIADYARHACGPAKQPGWALPTKFTPKNSYRDAYRVTGRFLLWLDDKHPGVVDQLHRKMQDGEMTLDDFKGLTGKTVDELWADCVADVNAK
jgi:hypothetical protein